MHRKKAMAQVQIREKKVWVDETPIPLMGGEVHYWRLAPENWRIVLTRVKELGINVSGNLHLLGFSRSCAGIF